jgi:hypothetical protein
MNRYPPAGRGEPCAELCFRPGDVAWRQRVGLLIVDSADAIGQCAAPISSTGKELCNF